MPHEHNSTVSDVTATCFPWTNTKSLYEGLKSGDLCITTVLSQFNAVMRETLKVIEEYANDEIKAHMERKIRVEKMEKLIKDLTEKCQGMQQAMLYKEEKYDEKCREVERYKVICELSANNAINDDVIDAYDNAESDHEDQLNSSFQSASFARPQQVPSRQLGQPKRNYKSHAKIDNHSIDLGNIEPMLDFDDTMSDRYVSYSEQPTRRHVNTSSPHKPYYPGTFTRPVGVVELSPSRRPEPESKLRERLGMMGGVNVRPRMNLEPALTENNHRSSMNMAPQVSKIPGSDQDRRVKIALSGQTNEVLSSNKNAVNKMRQRITDRELHRQIAGGGPHTRMALSSRRKKEWPF